MFTRQGKKFVLSQVLPAGLKKDDVIFVCIGSDLSIGDSLGPIVGSELENLGDACIGAKNSVGGFEVRKGPIHPGKGLGKRLSKIGDYSIAGIVSSQSPFDFFHDQVIHLSFVMDMAKVIVKEIHEFFLEDYHE
jgi:hypothetical protein